LEPWYSQTRTWSIQLTRLFSQTDTPGERDFAISLKELLSGNPYFQRHPDDLRLLRTQADPMERYVLMALVKGQGSQALVLTGHYDVVGIENYGELQALACDPEALLPHLINVLQAEDATSRGLSSADRLALDDLLSGQYLPGRGILDMKSGLAAGLSVLERFSQLPLQERHGSLLFIAVPDEEITSNGARTTGALLPGLSREWGLEFAAAINLDASDVHGDGSRGQAVYLGSVGKLLPSVYLIGRETHAGSPFSGVNATLLASELTRRIECNPSFCESIDGFTSAPPTCLKQGDTKSRYDVTTPTYTWCYYNWLILRRPVGEILATVRDMTHEALNAATASICNYAGRFAGMSSLHLSLPDWQPQVYTFAEIKSLAMERNTGFKQQMEALEAQLAQDPALDTPSCCQRLTETAWAASGLSGPAGVVGFASIYYPPVSRCRTAAGGALPPDGDQAGGSGWRARAYLHRDLPLFPRHLGSQLSGRTRFPR